VQEELLPSLFWQLPTPLVPSEQYCVPLLQQTLVVVRPSVVPQQNCVASSQQLWELLFRLHLVMPATQEHVPLAHVRLYVAEQLDPVVLQQTPLRQLPDRHTLPEVQLAPLALNGSQPLLPQNCVPLSQQLGPQSEVPEGQTQVPEVLQTLGELHAPLQQFVRQTPEAHWDGFVQAEPTGMKQAPLLQA
jgi:hypothetical protein